MKKITKMTDTLIGVLFFTAMAGMPVSAQASQKASGDSKAISPEVMKITERSCAKCHINSGMGGLNMSEWDKYTPEKKTAKAKAMCDAVSGRKMPPKNYITNNPGAAITGADIKTICDWAASLQPARK
ncbi:MAG: heme-binding domain-containing protein [Bacteroidales bacterium]